MQRVMMRLFRKICEKSAFHSSPRAGDESSPLTHFHILQKFETFAAAEEMKPLYRQQMCFCGFAFASFSPH